MIIWGANVLARKQRLLDQPRHLLVPFLPVTGLLSCSWCFRATPAPRW